MYGRPSTSTSLPTDSFCLILTMIHPTSFVLVFLLIIDYWFLIFHLSVIVIHSHTYLGENMMPHVNPSHPTQSIHTFILPLQDHWEGCILHTGIVFIPSYPLLFIVYYFAVYILMGVQQQIDTLSQRRVYSPASWYTAALFLTPYIVLHRYTRRIPGIIL